jgi:dTDP-4-amino-4,6-dideoxy-D-galactose acyltransferase
MDRLWEILDWDSTFFEKTTARIAAPLRDDRILGQILAECRAAGVEVLYYLAPIDDEQCSTVAERGGFHLVDIRVTLEWQIQNQAHTQVPQEIVLRDAGDEDIPALQAIARNSYQHSRYYHDQHYSRERCDQLYAVWIARSCRSDDEHVIVAEQSGTPIGYISCRFGSQGQGQIGLVGVRTDMQGGGVGRLLVRAAQRRFFEQSIERVIVVTQGRNIEAQRLYQRCGFVTNQMQLWYHKWFE